MLKSVLKKVISHIYKPSPKGEKTFVGITKFDVVKKVKGPV